MAIKQPLLFTILLLIRNPARWSGENLPENDQILTISPDSVTFLHISQPFRNSLTLHISRRVLTLNEAAKQVTCSSES